MFVWRWLSIAELAAFAQFASDLDEATRKQLDRGERVMELMKQNQYSPLSVGEMAFSLLAANEGYLDEVDAKKVVDFEAAMHCASAYQNADLLGTDQRQLAISMMTSRQL